MCNCNNTIITTIQNCTCSQTSNDCDCPTRLSSDCITFKGEDLACSGILKDQDLTTTITQLDSFICDAVEQVSNKLSIVNVGTGSGLYAGIDSLGRKKLKSLTSSDSSVSITQNTDEIDITVDIVIDDSNVVHLTGSETVTSQKTFITQVSESSIIINNTATSGDSLVINNTGNNPTDKFGARINNSGDANIGLGIFNSSNGYALYSESANGYGIYSSASGSAASAFEASISNASIGLDINSVASASGKIFSGKKESVETSYIDRDGNVGAKSFIKSGGTSAQFLMADGSVSTIDGSETKVAAGTNVTVTGSGTIASPYIVNASASSSNASSARYTPTVSNGVNTTLSALNGVCTYCKIDNIVIGNVTFSTNITAANTLTKVNITIPFNRATSTGLNMGVCTIVSPASTGAFLAAVAQSTATTSFDIVFYPATTGSTTGYVTFQYDITS